MNYCSPLHIIPALLVSAFTAVAAPNIIVEGRDATTGIWSNIDDGDLNPSQVVTDFGNVDTGSSRTRTYRLRNNGNETLTVSSFSSDDSRFVLTGLINGSVVAANGTNEFEITYTPTSLGTQQAVITIRSNDPDDEDPYTFGIEGTGTGPEILIGGREGTSGTYYAVYDGDTTPSTTSGTNFGTIAAGTTRTRYFLVQNDGNQSLNVQQPAFTGTNKDDFSVQSLTSAINIGAGNTRAFEIRFSPATAGIKTATFTMANNDANENPYSFTVTGVATGVPEIAVEGNDTISWPDIADGDLDPNQVVTNFGNVQMGSSGLRYFRIRNVGTDTLNITSRSSSSSQFTFASLTAPLSIAPNSEDVFQVRYTPTTLGDTTTTITILNNDPEGESTYTFALKGSGLGAEISIGGSTTASNYTNIADADPTPSTSQGTAFGTVAIGSSVTRYFRVTNSGTDGLNLQTPTLTGTGAGHFSVHSLTSAINVGPGNTRDFEIRFTPTSVGLKTATFSVSSNDADESPYNFIIEGTATGTPSIEVQGDNGVGWSDIDDGDIDAEQGVTDFGNVIPNTSEQRTYRIRNRGTSPLTISSTASSSSRFAVVNLPNGTSIAAGADREFAISFSPLDSGAVQSIITINSNAPGGLASYTIGLKGKGKGPEIKVEVWRNSSGDASYHEVQHNDFTPSDADGTIIDTTAVFGYDDTLIRITNTGDDGLNINLPFVAGPGSQYFNVNGIQAATNIAPGNSRDFEVRFLPVVAGTFQVQVAIPSNDGDEGVFRFDLQGTAVAVPLVSLDRYTGIAWVNAHNDSHEMGNVGVGNYDEIKYRLKNTGAGAITFTRTNDLDPQFTLRSIALPYTLAAGDEKEFFVRFRPDDYASSTTAIEFYASGQNSPEVETSLTGTGIGPRILVEGRGPDGNFYEITDGATVQSALNGTDFGNWDVSAGKLDHTFRITNTGNRQLRVLNWHLTGQNDSQFDASDIVFNWAVELPFIEPGGTNLFTLSFNPDNPGIKTATFTLGSNDDVTGPYNFRLKGTAFGHPEIEVKGHSAALDPFNDITDGDTTTRNTDGTSFGNVNVAGGSEAHVFKIKNTGTDVLLIDSITENSPHFTITGASTIESIPAGGEAEFTVTYNPNTYGSHTAVIEIENDDADEGTFTFTISGSGRAPDLEVRSAPPGSVLIPDGDNSASVTETTDFGVVDIAASTLNREFRLVNTGNEPLTITALNSTSAQFIISGINLPRTIDPGTAYPITIGFNPSSIGEKTATISFTSDDPVKNPYNFQVKGYGGDSQPEIQVIGDNSTPFTSGQTVTTVTAGTEFGNVTAGTGNASRTYSIYNGGTGTLNISSITDNGAAFSVSGAPTAVAAFSWGTFTVNYAPPGTGTHNAIITIASNDADEGAFTFAVRGTGIAAPPPAKPEIDVFGGDTLAFAIGAGDTAPTEGKGTDFDRVEIGTSATRTFRIRNTGTATLTISSAAFASAPRFTLTGVAASIPAGGFDDFTVTYTPTSEGSTTRVLTINSNDENEAAYAITFTAVAVAPPGTLAVTALEPEGSKKVTLTFTSIPGRTYRIARSDDMQTWVGVAGLSGLAGDTAPQSYSMPIGTIGKRYWRVEQE